MPIANSTTMIQSCLREILQCLRNPSPGSALAPLAASESAKLCLLAELFAPPAPTQLAPNNPLILAPVLRVPVPPLATPDEARATAPPLRVPVPPIAPAAPLRVPEDAIAPPPVPLHATPAIQDLPPSTHTISHCPSNGQPPFSTFVSTDMACPTMAQKVHKVLTTTTSPPSDNPTPPSHPAHIDDPSLPIAYLALAKFLQLDPHQLEILNGKTAYKAIHPDTGRDVEYPELLRSSDSLLWEESCAEEAGRLAQGYKQAKGTNTIHFICHDQLPKGRRAIYLRNMVADRPQKEQPCRVRWTVGGNLINYPGNVSTKTAGLTTAKLLFNSVLSTPDTRFMTMDIKDFYLNTPMDRYKYMMIPVSLIPKAIFDQYKLGPLVHNGHVYVEIRKGMYGLPQAGKIANDALVPYLPSTAITNALTPLACSSILLAQSFFPCCRRLWCPICWS
jgi:hypothetical protein